MTTSAYLEVAIQAAKSAGSILLNKLGKVGYQEKHPADLVTEADIAAQETIQNILLKAFPTHSILGEELVCQAQLAEHECGSQSPKELPLTWIIDPLDGTTNFVHQVPFFATSIGLTCGNDLLCGVIFDPVAEECFTAAYQQGAFLNGRRIRCRNVEKMSDSLFSISFPMQTNSESKYFHIFNSMRNQYQGIRRTGSTALNLAYLAAGRFDLFSGLASHAWDVAAGVLLVREAGGIVTAENGLPFDLASPSIIASATEKLHQEYLQSVNSISLP